MSRLSCLTALGALLVACAPAPRRVDAGTLTVVNGVTLDGAAPFTGIAVGMRADGRRESTRYVHGRRDGADVTWHTNGRMAESRHYARGLESGRHRGWWPNGRARFDFTYANGLLEGETREWFADGRLYREFHYVAGQEEGNQRMWWADGTLRASYVVRSGRRYGLMGAKGCITRDTTTATPAGRIAS